MIGRLAQAILKHNPHVLRALRLTYSHVFLDEFQHTTGAQYALTMLAFAGSEAVLTAVGDTKQRIMTWAGAEAEVFAWFEQKFRAKREMLQMNHRSNRRIVQIINDLVTEVEPEAVQTLCARANDLVPNDAAAFWIFDSDDQEAQHLADVIADDIANGGRTSDDFTLLVRMKPDKAEAQLRDAFVARGLQLRNEARSIKGIAVTDLLADELVSLLLGLMRISLGTRAHEVYGPAQDTLAAVCGADHDNPIERKRLEDKIRSLMRVIRELTARPPDQVDMAELIARLVAEIGEPAFRRVFRQYENDAYFRDLQAALALLMTEYASTAGSWVELIDAVEGKGQVRLMTIHKSKGLEYHTVIFIGLHQNAFFGYRNNKAEETNTFFVALSRARERVYFTRSKQSGDVAQIKGLVDLLTKAAVPFVEIQ